LDPVDFERREWVPHSGWPFDRTTLEPFYRQALGVLGISATVNDSTGLTGPEAELFSPQSRLATVLSRFAPRTVFTRDYSAALAADDRVTVYLSSTLLELIVRDNFVSHARVATAPGHEFQVAARFFILAAGGIENARLLLLSNSVHPNGLGNEHDLVGRYFMDHPSFRLGVLTPTNPDLFRSVALYDHHFCNGEPAMGKLTFRENTMRHEQMLNMCVTLRPRGRDSESPATTVAKELLEADSPAAASSVIWRELRTLTKHWDELLAGAYNKLRGIKPIYFENKGGWSRLPVPHRRFRRLEFCSLAEQAPNPDNRITLARETDRLGQRKAGLHWRWSEVDLRSIRRAQDILKEELENQGLGPFVRQYELDGTDRPPVTTPHHHIGTTRMHVDPRRGVVDADCRVHSLSNLYLAGSSVFPTAGFANPTLTIVALAIRLSYHLKELMKTSSSSVSGSIVISADSLGTAGSAG
jgi:choline dehydrogenase-like flavoprotein